MEKLLKAGKALVEPCCAEAYFLLFGQKWMRKDKSFSVVQFELNPLEQISPQSHTILHLSLMQSKGFCGLIKNNTFFLLLGFYDNGICIYLCNYSQGHIKAPDMGVCSCRHGKQ